MVKTYNGAQTRMLSSSELGTGTLRPMVVNRREQDLTPGIATIIIQPDMKNEDVDALIDQAMTDQPPVGTHFFMLTTKRSFEPSETLTNVVYRRTSPYARSLLVQSVVSRLQGGEAPLDVMDKIDLIFAQACLYGLGLDLNALESEDPKDQAKLNANKEGVEAMSKLAKTLGWDRFAEIVSQLKQLEGGVDSPLGQARHNQLNKLIEADLAKKMGKLSAAVASQYLGGKNSILVVDAELQAHVEDALKGLRATL